MFILYVNRIIFNEKRLFKVFYRKKAKQKATLIPRFEGPNVIFKVVKRNIYFLSSSMKCFRNIAQQKAANI